MLLKKYNHSTNLKKILLVLCLVMVGGLTLTKLVDADSAITQGYNTNQYIPPESIVSVKHGTSNEIIPTNLSNANSLVGVIIDNNNAQVSVASGSNQVQVATSGVNQVLVSNINGNIVSGDEITASPINGVGMLVNQNAEIIGTAQSNFPNSSASKQTITNSSGVKQTVEIGTIPVLVSVGYYTKQPTKTLIPTAIQNLANALAGKQVKALPIIISLAIFVVTLVVVVSIIYSLVHGSIISVGRNPMAQSAVYRNVLQLSALVVAIIAVAMFAIFMILTRVG